MSEPGVGDKAPGFTLPGTGGRDYDLESYRGRNVVLVFYPGDNTPVCTAQLTTYTRDISQFSELGAQVLAISPQSVESHEEFSARHGGFAFPLLADVDKTVAAAYDVLGPVGFYRRCTFVIDADGIVRYAHRALAGLTYRPVAELVEVLAALGPG
jgi:peroxiredoxin Q/BCP